MPCSASQKDGVPPTDAYTEYLHKPNKNMNEHDYFFKAKAELQKHHHEKVTKVTTVLRLIYTDRKQMFLWSLSLLNVNIKLDSL